MKIAIIGGSGKMGQWFARFLKQQNMEVFISGKQSEKLRDIGLKLGVSFGNNQEIVRNADIIILSVPINSFESIAREIAPCLEPHQKIFDITSVKVMPVEVMHSCFPRNLVLGTHPLFGPGAQSLAGMNFVLTPTNSSENELAQKTGRFLERRGARVTTMSPQEHDKMMAFILGLTHFIALVTADTLADQERLRQMKEIGGISFKVLMTLVESVLSEDPTLYSAIQMALPDLHKIESEFLARGANWVKMVRSHDSEGFVERMSRLKTVFAEDSDFGKSYEKMYSLIREKDTEKTPDK